jgi:hypothetical protein
VTLPNRNTGYTNFRTIWTVRQKIAGKSQFEGIEHKDNLKSWLCGCCNFFLKKYMYIDANYDINLSRCFYYIYLFVLYSKRNIIKRREVIMQRLGIERDFITDMIEKEKKGNFVVHPFAL